MSFSRCFAKTTTASSEKSIPRLQNSQRVKLKTCSYLEEAALVTLGVCYERVPRFGGGAYHSILRRLETLTDEPLRAAIKSHQKHASMVLDVEEKIAAAVKKLKERGLLSPYLRSFVVARINPLRWIKGEPPALEDVFKTMRERAAKFNVENIRPQDLAGGRSTRRRNVRMRIKVGMVLFPNRQYCCLRNCQKTATMSF
jgi:hypothetical protein